MDIRRLCLACAVLLPSTGLAAPAPTPVPHVRGATAITQVFGDGQKLTAVAIEYDRAIDGASLSPADFRVAGRRVTAVHTGDAADPDRTTPGRVVIVALSPDDAAASLRIGGGPGGPGGPGPGGPGGGPGRPRPAADGAASPPSGAPGGGGPPRFGPRQIFRPAAASVVQSGEIATTDGARYAASTTPIATGAVRNLIVDDFRQLEFRDPKTGGVLKYNLFVPKGYVPGKAYPLVLFMHDAGTLSDDTSTTLKQGLGAVVWASAAEQAKHPAFVLAPQYAQAAVDDASTTSAQMETTVALVESLTRQYGLDRSRLYTTGQSMGAMLSIAIDIAHPDLFAASYIVAGQWDAAKVAPLARQKLWIVVSEGDLRAYPGQNAITQALEARGAKVARAVWDGTATPARFAADVAAMAAEGAPINYAALRKGTVVPAGQRDDGGSNHINTWRIAYSIAGIRDWLFRQHR